MLFLSFITLHVHSCNVLVIFVRATKSLVGQTNSVFTYVYFYEQIKRKNEHVFL